MKHEKLILVGLTFMLIRMNLKTSHDDLIFSISQKHGNNPHLVKAIIFVESRFKPDAHRQTSREDSRGLGQINKNLAYSLGVKNLNDLFDPAFNIEIMNRAIDDHKTRFDSIFDIIAAYNAGSVKLKKGSVFYINETYVKKVYSRFLLYSFLFV